MTEKPNYRFEDADDHLYDMLERHQRWEWLDERDDPVVVLDLIADGRVEIDPSGALIRMTAKGVDWAVFRSEDWHGHRFPPFVPTMSVRRYAKHRGVPKSVIRAACEERIKFALWGSLIDHEVADALWPRHEA